MDEQELDWLLHQNTEMENFYLENPGSLSPQYKTMERRILGEKKVYCFNLPHLKENEVLIRKDSRYTSVPFYVHTNINMNYIYSGTCTYIIDDVHITLQQGDVCIFDKDVVRSKMVTGENDIIINISMSEDFFTDGFISHTSEESVMASFILDALSKNKDHNHYIIFQTNKSPIINNLFNRILIEYFDNMMYSRKIIQSYLRVVFLELMRLYHINSGKHLIRISKDPSNNIMDILHYIEKHYSDCTLEKLSKMFGYHPKYLSTLIKSKTGKSFKCIQLEQRLNVSCSLLKNTNQNIQDIANSIGIQNLNFFYNKFKEHYGMSPNEYRQHL